MFDDFFGRIIEQLPFTEPFFRLVWSILTNPVVWLLVAISVLYTILDGLKLGFAEGVPFVLFFTMLCIVLLVFKQIFC